MQSTASACFKLTLGISSSGSEPKKFQKIHFSVRFPQSNLREKRLLNCGPLFIKRLYLVYFWNLDYTETCMFFFYSGGLISSSLLSNCYFHVLVCDVAIYSLSLHRYRIFSFLSDLASSPLVVSRPITLLLWGSCPPMQLVQTGNDPSSETPVDRRGIWVSLHLTFLVKWD